MWTFACCGENVGDQHIATYLEDHLSGAVGGITMLEVLRDEHLNHPLGGFATELLAEIEADKITLQKLMEQLGLTSSTPKEAAAWIAAKVSRVKLGYSVAGEFGVFEALEALSLGILGKRALWRALEVSSPSGLHDFDFKQLVARAETQHAQVEEYRLKYAMSALFAVPK